MVLRKYKHIKVQKTLSLGGRESNSLKVSLGHNIIAEELNVPGPVLLVRNVIGNSNSTLG